MRDCSTGKKGKFQSTLPARGATGCAAFIFCDLADFNPRSLRGERPAAWRYLLSGGAKFQSTLPARGATWANMANISTIIISIHAPREGSDPIPESLRLLRSYFNPRSPRGERRTLRSTDTRASVYFNPRSLRGERRPPAPQVQPNDEFQSTLPARGATRTDSTKPISLLQFQSTLPARGATVAYRKGFKHTLFQSTLPARGATLRVALFQLRHQISIHAPREGSDLSHPA